MRKLTLEERVTRLERVIKNELLLFKPSRKDAENFVSKLKDKYSSSLSKYGAGYLSSKNFHVSFYPDKELSQKINGLHFIIAAKENGKIYCTAADNSNNQIATKFLNDKKDINTAANFIISQVNAAKKKYNVKESKLYKYENVSLNDFTILQLEKLIVNAINNDDYIVSIDERNSVNGELTVTVEFEDDSISVNIIALDYDRYNVDGKRLNSIEEVADYIADLVYSD